MPMMVTTSTCFDQKIIRAITVITAMLPFTMKAMIAPHHDCGGLHSVHSVPVRIISPPRGGPGARVPPSWWGKCVINA